MTETEDKIIEERKEKIAGFIKKKASWIVYLILGIIIWINFYIRTLPMRINPSTGKPGLWDFTTNNWTLGPDLDPFLFMRYARYIVKNGGLMKIDIMRYAPLGFDTAKESVILPYLIAYFHKFINLFKSVSIEYSSVLFPVIASIFTVIFFFLLIRKIFERKGKKISSIIALIGSALFVILPSVLSRTIAGIPEKESVGFCLMFLISYLYLIAWKSENIKKAAIWGTLSGISTAIMGLIWGGVIFVYGAIAIASLISFLLGKIRKKEAIIYSCWLATSIFFWLSFTNRFGSNFFSSLKEFLLSPVIGLAGVVLFFIVIYFAIFKTKLKESKFFQDNKIKKIPDTILVVLISTILLLFFSLIFLGPKAIIDMGHSVFDSLIKPTHSRLISTVAENKHSYFTNIASDMGPNFKGIPLLFWLFFTGSIFLFSEMIKILKLKEKIILISSYILFLMTLIFSRISESSKYLNGENGLSIFINILGYSILGFSVIYILYQKNKVHELSYLKDIPFSYIFLFSLTFVGMVAARSGIRFVMIFIPIAVISVAYLSVESVIKALKNRGEISKVLLWLTAVLVMAALILTFTAFYNSSTYSAKVNVPSAYTYQWQDAMQWVRENTPKNAIFGHWWDYGYWVQSIGERATMLDGGNFISYWNYLMGRHVLTGETEEEALEVLYNHNVTYFLIDSTDIGKYSAYSLIGSDENYDRFSAISTFFLDQGQIQETKEKITYVYQGGTMLDEDMLISEEGKQVLLPQQSTGIGLILAYANDKEEYSQPEAIIVYKNKQYRFPLRYLFINDNLIDFGIEKENTIEGCAYIVTRIGEDGAVNKMGVLMYLSPRNMGALWVRLYLLNQGEQFKLVHSESSMIHKAIKGQNIELPEIVYYRGIQGPIKIWKIEYTGKEKINPEYIQTNFPKKIEERRLI